MSSVRKTIKAQASNIGVQQGVDIARFEDYCCMLLILILIHYLLTRKLRKLRKLYKLLYLMHARS